jgi:hypothetical protein
MDLVKNSELTGLVLELLLKIGEEKAVSRHLSCVEIVFGDNNKSVPPEVSECLLRCWVDEDGDVREPVVERLGDIPFIDGRLYKFIAQLSSLPFGILHSSSSKSNTPNFASIRSMHGDL